MVTHDTHCSCLVSLPMPLRRWHGRPSVTPRSPYCAAVLACTPLQGVLPLQGCSFKKHDVAQGPGVMITHPYDKKKQGQLLFVAPDGVAQERWIEALATASQVYVTLSTLAPITRA